MLLRIVLLLSLTSIIHANCVIYDKETPLTTQLHDPLFKILDKALTCPQSIQEFKAILNEHHLKIQTSMVANRGKNNPLLGSFSFFESLSGDLVSGETIKEGDFFLGHFTREKKGKIILDQLPKPNKLLIELIAWDNQKALYNFYELRGKAKGDTRWFYRGDSADAFKDNTWLYRDNPKDQSHFGNRMRCSGCHNSGGPIFKEHLQPHNDWWTQINPLEFQPNTPDPEVLSLIEHLVDANELAQDVKKGAAKLINSRGMIELNKTLSLQEQLRPLFCTTEINLENALISNSGEMIIPSGFWINPLLGHFDLALPQAQYNQLLDTFGMNFPETPLQDADNPWLTPVKSAADVQAILALIEQKIIDKKFAQAVLMVDFKHPLFSTSRCNLLKLLPQHTTKTWYLDYLDVLNTQAKENPAAGQLLYNLTTATSLEMAAKVNDYESSLIISLRSVSGVHEAFQTLLQNRASVFNSEISQNPLGQILEPGFRVIFPVPATIYEGKV